MKQILTSCLLAAIAVVALSLGTSRAWAQDCGSVPEQPFAIAPASGPAAGLSGVWTGTWTIQVGLRAKEKHDATYCSKLHVSVTGAQSAAIMFCGAALPEGNIPQFCIKPEAKIAGNVLTFTTRNNYTYTFTLTDPSTLHGQFVSVFHASEQRTVETDFHK
jgi:hypothetical protein